MNNTKTLVSLSLLVGIGAALHLIMPGFFASGMKPDMMLTMMFLGILLFPQKKNVLLLGLATGILSGLTSTFPGGLVPNIIDKFITAFLFYLLVMLLKKYADSIVAVGILTAAGTIVSGTIFLTAALYIATLPAPFMVLFTAAVLPAVLLNTVAMIIIYPIVKNIARRTNITANA
ncbi:tryptophan transporter [Peribacillus sp. SCS-155]|uniref:tryptophan transporter n=1 Tax=Peribacillus sedimenti TaxID=3115297 RepID=UPI0039066589